jgi:hypothetical protein
MRKKLFKKPLLLLASVFIQGLASALLMAQTLTFSYTGAVQTFTVPAGVTSLTISASGAQGGGNTGGGLGALMSGDFTVTPGETINIVVGQQGQLQIGGQSQNSSGGGGGSFVYRNSSNLLLAAGGGGGGGFSGGGGGTDPTHGGGGGSFNAGINQVNVPGINQGNGVVTITLPNCIPPVVTLNNATLCQGETATITANASPAGNYTYSWIVPNGVTNPGNASSVISTVAGTYTVVAVDANTPNCPSTPTNATITVNPLPDVSAGADATICEGDSVIFSASGAIQYAWNNGVIDNTPFVPVANATYTVNGVDANGCIGTDALELTILSHSASSLTETAIDSYTLNGQTYTQSGVYTQVVPAANGCDSTITLNLTVSYTGLNELPQVNKTLVRITDLNGKLINRRKNTLMLFIYTDGTVERVMEFGE